MINLPILPTGDLLGNLCVMTHCLSTLRFFFGGGGGGPG